MSDGTICGMGVGLIVGAIVVFIMLRAKSHLVDAIAILAAVGCALFLVAALSGVI